MPDDPIQNALRPVRGCATDEQYREAYDKVMAIVQGYLDVIKNREAAIGRLKAERRDLQDEIDAIENAAMSRHQ